MSRPTERDFKKLDGLECAKKIQCKNPKYGNLKETDFRINESGNRDATCTHCRRRADRLRKAKSAGEPARKAKPKPSFWKEFKGYAWDCEAANFWIKRAWA